MTTSLVTAELVAAARELTGLENFGEPGLTPALDRMVHIINGEARLSEFGGVARQQHIVNLLSNRLRLMERVRQHPELAAQPIGRPIVIVGLPRSGTTKMQRMLARDERFNTIQTWECLFPVPLSADANDREMRVGGGKAFCEAFKTMAPEFYAAHPVDAEEPEEDMVLMQHSFLTESLDAEMRIPSYIEWLKTQDHLPMYRQFALFLRVLADQHGKQGQPWLLKGTYHGIYFEELLQVFPDARIVYCHRDPVETISSYSSLVSKMRRMLSDDVDNQDVGRELLRYWTWHQNRMLEVRSKVPAAAILDVDYIDIVNNAEQVAERIYAFAGIELTEAARTAMAAWRADNAQHKHGKHAYSSGEYGIDAAEIAEACAAYRERYITRK